MPNRSSTELKSAVLGHDECLQPSPERVRGTADVAQVTVTAMRALPPSARQLAVRTRTRRPAVQAHLATEISHIAADEGDPHAT